MKKIKLHTHTQSERKTCFHSPRPAPLCASPRGASVPARWCSHEPAKQTAHLSCEASWHPLVCLLQQLEQQRKHDLRRGRAERGVLISSARQPLKSSTRTRVEGVCVCGGGGDRSSVEEPEERRGAYRAPRGYRELRNRLEVSDWHLSPIKWNPSTWIDLPKNHQDSLSWIYDGRWHVTWHDRLSIVSKTAMFSIFLCTVVWQRGKHADPQNPSAEDQRIKAGLALHLILTNLKHLISR